MGRDRLGELVFLSNLGGLAYLRDHGVLFGSFGRLVFCYSNSVFLSTTKISDEARLGLCEKDV